MSSMFSSESSAFLQGSLMENMALLAFTWVWWVFVNVCQEIRLNSTENLAISLKKIWRSWACSPHILCAFMLYFVNVLTFT